MEKRAPLGADLVIPLLALAFAVYFFISIADLEWEAKANGVIIGALLVPLAVLQLARVGLAVARGRGSLGFAPLVQPPHALRRRIGMVALTIAFVATVRWLGVGLGLFLAFCAAFMLMGVQGTARIVVISLALALAATLLFVVALDSSLPRGPVEHLIAHLRS